MVAMLHSFEGPPDTMSLFHECFLPPMRLTGGKASYFSRRMMA